MKKKIFAFLLLFVVSFTAGADTVKEIPFKKMPVLAQKFVRETYRGWNVLSVKEEFETSHDKLTYVLSLSDGTRVLFDKMGVWKEIDAKNKSLPESVVPKNIRKFVDDLYQNEKIIKISRNLYGYMIKLLNGKEIIFDENGKFVRFYE